MSRKPPKKPYYPLALVKEKIKAREYEITPKAQFSARRDFEWELDKVRKCLLKLNDRDNSSDKNKNHFYKTDTRNSPPKVPMDFYRARYIMDGESVHIHLYINQEDEKLYVDSFHELEFYD